ncbi:MAG: kelch repeat-containing protein [Pseudomonadota bacterium]
MINNMNYAPISLIILIALQFCSCDTTINYSDFSDLAETSSDGSDENTNDGDEVLEDSANGASSNNANSGSSESENSASENSSLNTNSNSSGNDDDSTEASQSESSDEDLVDTWLTGLTEPSIKRTHGRAAAINGKIYLIGGYNSDLGVSTKGIYAYNP